MKGIIKKEMKAIKFNEFVMFTKARTDGYQKCIYCGKSIGKNKVGLSMVKKCTMNYNVWLHINCIKDFCEDIENFKKENLRNILIEGL